MRLAKSSSRPNLPEARAGAAPSQSQQQPSHQHHHQGTACATPAVMEPVGAAQSQLQQHQQGQIINDADLVRADGVGHGVQLPSSNMVATSQYDAAHAIDFGAKFMGGGLDAMPDTVTRVQQPTPPATVAAGETVQAQPRSQQRQHMQTHYLTAEQQPTPTAVGSSMDYYVDKPRRQTEASPQQDHDEAECHPFWLSWRDIFLGIWLIVTGVLKIPLVLGDGMGKALHHTPELYGDKTVRKWPRLTGFPHGCVAGCLGLWFGIYDGSTDWVTLPYKAVRDGEGIQGFLKGFLQGLANMIFKVTAGCFAIAFHPIFGIYKEFSKIKVVVKHEKDSRIRDTPPV